MLPYNNRFSSFFFLNSNCTAVLYLTLGITVLDNCKIVFDNLELLLINNFVSSIFFRIFKEKVVYLISVEQLRLLLTMKKEERRNSAALG